MINSVVIIGRLTRDIEVRYTEDNKAIGNITIAVPRSFKNANGEYESDFINCVLFREIAERVKEYTHKGDLIAVRGRIQTRNYEDKEGNKKYITEVVAEKISFLSMKKNGKESKEEIKVQPKEESDPYAEMGREIELNEEDLPF